MDKEERLETLNKFYAYRKIAKDIWSEIDLIRERGKFEVEPRCIFVVGETGVGKTEIFKEYLRNNPPSDYCRSVAYLKVLSETSLVTVVRMLLDALGVPGALTMSGVKDNFVAQAIEQFVLQGVEVLIADEIQNATEDRTEGSLRKTADTLKNLAKIEDKDGSRPMPMVFSGLPDALSLLDANEQLDDFFRRIFTVKHFEDDKKGTKEFLLFLADWDKKMPLDERSGLAEPKMADKIAFAGGGNVRYTAYMLREAAIQAINKSSSRILNSHLSKGYDSIARFFPGKENPFRKRK